MKPAGRIVITGASAGVGRATAIAFARLGWSVALVARGQKGLEAAYRDVAQAGGRPMIISADVSDPSNSERIADQVTTEWGGIDVWVNNAMVTLYAPSHEISPAEYRRITDVTYLGQVYGTLAALKQMRSQGFGTIIQVGSALAYRSIPLQAAYCAAKAAVRGFTDSLRCELLREDSPIQISMVHLPAVNTPQFDWARSRLPRTLQPVPPIYDPSLAADAILAAARTAPRELWVGAPTAKAIIGNMVAPGLLDRFLATRAWDGQMTDEPAVLREDNLFKPADQDLGMRGRFDAASRRHVVAAPASVVTALGFAAALLSFASITQLVSKAFQRPRHYGGRVQ